LEAPRSSLAATRPREARTPLSSIRGGGAGYFMNRATRGSQAAPEHMDGPIEVERPWPVIPPIVALAVLIVLAALASVADVYERVAVWTRAHEHWELDELVITLALWLPAFLAYTYLHMRRRRYLRAYNSLLEQRVESRTADLSHANAMLSQARGERSQLLQQILAAQEMERARLSRELHDQLGQVLSYMLVGLRLTKDEDISAKAAEHISKLSDLTREALEDVRSLAVDLHPASLEHLGLVEAIEQEVRRIAADLPLDIEVCVGEPRDFPVGPAVQITLYRVTLAAFANIVRHADAHNVRISIQHEDDRIRLDIEDDGVGFDVESTMRGAVEDRFGLLAMEERMEAVGGTIAVHSRPGHGATVSLETPAGTVDSADEHAT